MLSVTPHASIADLLSKTDWAATALGPREGWPTPLAHMVDVAMNSPAPMLILWRPSLTQIYNDAFAKLLGDRHPSAFAAPIKKHPVHDRVLAGESLHVTDGSTIDGAYSPLCDANGAIAGILVIATASHASLDAELREREERLRLGILAGNLGTWDWDIPNNRVTWSDRLYDIHQLRRDEFGGRVEDFAKLVHPEDATRVQTALQHALERDEHYSIEFRTVRGDGDVRWLSTTGKVFRDPGGKPVRMLGATTDINDRKLAEATLAQTSERLQLAQRAAHIGVFDWHIPSGTVVWTEEEERLFGLRPGAFEGTIDGWERRVLPEDRARILAQFEAAMRARQRDVDFEFRIIRADNAVRWIEGSGRFLYGEDGKPLRMVGVNIDVTDRRRAERAAGEAERRYRAVFEAARDSMFIYSPDGLVVDVNPAACRMYGYAREQLIGLDAKSAIHPKAQPHFREFMRVTGAGGEYNCETVESRPDGSEFPIEVQGTSLMYNGRLHLMSIVRDISERNRAIDRLTQLHAAAAALSEAQTPDDVARVTVDQCIAAIGASAGSLGLLSDDGEYLEIVRHTGYPKELIDPWRRFRVSVEVPIAKAVRTGEAIFLCSPEDRQKQFPAITPLRAHEGTKSTASVPLVIGGKAVGVIGLSFPQSKPFPQEERDLIISIGRQCAQALERARLFEAERSARADAERASDAKSEFLATLSHELRTPLTPVLLTVSLMERHPNLPDDLREDVATVRRNVELESRLISDLLDLTRIARGKLAMEFQEVDAHVLLRSAIDICQREASARLIVELNARHHVVRGDSTRIQQVYWNLINNALKFTDRTGTISIRSTDVQSDGTDGAQGDCFRVQITDTGVGIDPDLLPKLFNAFEQGEVRIGRQQAGLGLGLAISRRLVEAHGGRIDAYSEGRGRGATFTVDLPATRIAAPTEIKPPPETRPTRADGRSLSVLLVEDNEPTLNVMTRLLRQLGHRVTGATTLVSATAAARQQQFDLLLSDLGLPDGSGLDLMRQLRAQYGGRSIALTGYGMENDIGASREAGFAEHLTKPIDLEQLEEAIRRVTARVS